jgi:hypothetical protein
MESCVMESSKLLVNLWGVSISAENSVAIVAAVIIVGLIVFGTRRRF